MVRVSFVVPVFRIPEIFLRACIDSLLTQTMEDFEVLIIDDGSPDNCGLLCDELAKKDGRIRVFHQENAGVSVARNKGIENAKGEYIVFVDPDDWVDEDLVRNVCMYMDVGSSDVLLYAYKSVFPHNTVTHIMPQNMIYKGDRIKDLQLGILNPKGDYDYNIPASPWAKAFRKDFLIKNDLRYVPGLSRMQDNVFCFDAYGKAKRVEYYGFGGYFWRSNQKSICNRYNPDIFNASESVIKELLTRVNKTNDRQYREALRCKIVLITLGEYMRSYFRHPDAPNSRKRMIEEFATLCRQPLYEEAIREVNKMQLSIRYRVKLDCVRLKMFHLLWFVIDLEEVLSKIKSKITVIKEK